MIFSGQFAELEREIVEATVADVLRIIDDGEMLGRTLPSAVNDERLKQRLRDVRNELKRLRAQSGYPLPANLPNLPANGVQGEGENGG